jgi:uncharacterized membrane protein
LLWFGSASVYIDLNPIWFRNSVAYAIDGAIVVGYGYTGDCYYHALLWSGNAASYVDLNPTGFISSFAYGVRGTQQVGYGTAGPDLDSNTHALLWTGTPASVVDLHPAGFSNSSAWATNGTQQVGGGDGRALLWTGTPASVVDLSQFLPASYSWSCAYAIDDIGNIVGCAEDDLGNRHAILWQIVPEPATSSLLPVAGLAVLRRRRK